MKANKTKGITLIALVITIIVLLILAGVAISTLTGDNGILGKAVTAKNMTEVANEREAIELAVTLAEMQDKSDELNKYYLGTALYDKNLENSNKWNIISINEKEEIYGTGWNYIKTGDEIPDYGNAKNEWLVNYETGEIIRLEKDNYVELSYNSGLAVTEGLVFNVDSMNMSNNDLTTWGNDVELHGFEGQTAEGLAFDGVDDYISFKSTANYSKGFTWSFYGKVYTGDNFFAKQRSGDVLYSYRFGLTKDYIKFNTSKKLANSTWSLDQDGNNGILLCRCNYNLGDTAYIDITFNPQKNQFSAYQNGKLLDETTTEHDYWHGEDGGRQIFEDDSIDCYLGRHFGGVGIWNYVKLDIYSMRLYNRELNENEIKSNYERTVTFHNLESKL